MSYKKEILKLRNEGKTYNEIKDILGCTKSTISFHCKNNGIGGLKHSKLSEDEKIKMNKFYQNHTAEETSLKFGVSKGTVKHYCVKENRGNLTLEDKKKRRSEAVQRRRRKVKEMSIEYKGGCCEKCGYNKCSAALGFHNTNPDEKDFGIASKGYTRSWDKVKKELDKCILVCSNCHAEIHEEIKTLQ